MSLTLPSNSDTETRYQGPSGIGKKINRALSKSLLDMFRNQGTSGLGTPLGILGPIYQNLFGEDSSKDYLGARSALQDTLSGEGLGKSIGIARGQLLPGTLRSISEGSAALRSASGPLGLRFSTDLANNQQDLTNRAFEGLDQQSLAAGLNIFGQRAKSAQSIFDLIGQLGQQNNPLALLMALRGVPGFGSKGGSSGGASASYNYQGDYGSGGGEGEV